jgi:hypothetical protein
VPPADISARLPIFRYDELLVLLLFLMLAYHVAAISKQLSSYFLANIANIANSLKQLSYPMSPVAVHSEVSPINCPGLKPAVFCQ